MPIDTNNLNISYYDIINALNPIPNNYVDINGTQVHVNFLANAYRAAMDGMDDPDFKYPSNDDMITFLDDKGLLDGVVQGSRSHLMQNDIDPDVFVSAVADIKAYLDKNGPIDLGDTTPDTASKYPDVGIDDDFADSLAKLDTRVRDLLDQLKADGIRLSDDAFRGLLINDPDLSRAYQLGYDGGISDKKIQDTIPTLPDAPMYQDASAKYDLGDPNDVGQAVNEPLALSDQSMQAALEKAEIAGVVDALAASMEGINFDATDGKNMPSQGAGRGIA